MSGGSPSCDESLASIPDMAGGRLPLGVSLSDLPPVKVQVVDAGLPENQAEMYARLGWDCYEPVRDEGGDGEASNE